MNWAKGWTALLSVLLVTLAGAAKAADDWPQLKLDGRHSGDAADRSVKLPLGLLAAVPLTDAVLTAPAIAKGRVYVVDAAGVAHCVDLDTLQVVWQRETRGGQANCNNVSSPAVAGEYLHFGTMAGSYYVLHVADGTVAKEIRCGEPIFGCPVVSNGRVYFVTLGSQVYALEPDGTICWKWDYVREHLGFTGNRFSGADWLKHKAGRVTTADQFCCAWNPAAVGKTLVVPAGGAVVWLEDAGERRSRSRGAHASHTHLGPEHRLPRYGLPAVAPAGQRRPGRQAATGGRRSQDGLRAGHADQHEWRTAEFLFGELARRRRLSLPARRRFWPLPTSRRSAGPESSGWLSLDRLTDPGGRARDLRRSGREALRRAALAGGQGGSFQTAFGKAISAPAAVSDGRVYFGCDDGYLYVLGPEGQAALPTADLQLWQLRTPPAAEHRDPRDDWFTSFGNWGNTNVTRQAVKPPFRVKWIRRFEGTTKHFSTCGGGRMYTHTAEGQIFAVEQETGRLLWRRYFPGVHICYTSPLYYQERVLVPQAGLERCRLRCLDAATGELLWEAPFRRLAELESAAAAGRTRRAGDLRLQHR